VRNGTGCAGECGFAREGRRGSEIAQIIGESQKMRDLRQLIQTVAASNATVLILGESGTGKELIAGSLHSLSARRQANYIRINCAAIPENLLESELFGTRKGLHWRAQTKTRPSGRG